MRGISFNKVREVLRRKEKITERKKGKHLSSYGKELRYVMPDRYSSPVTVITITKGPISSMPPRITNFLSSYLRCG